APRGHRCRVPVASLLRGARGLAARAPCQPAWRQTDAYRLLLVALLRGRRFERDDIARLLDCSPRQVVRDLDELSEIGNAFVSPGSDSRSQDAIFRATRTHGRSGSSASRA